LSCEKREGELSRAGDDRESRSDREGYIGPGGAGVYVIWKSRHGRGGQRYEGERERA